MATLLDLWRAVFPAARPFGPVADAREPVGWVRVLRPRVPAFDALEPGDLAIVPSAALAVVAPGEEDLAALVAALVATPVAGVVIIEPDAGLGASTPPGASGASGASTAPGASMTPGASGASGASATPVADRLAGSLAAAGVPTLVTTGDPSALERSAIGYLVNRRAELDRQAADLERQLERLALAGRGIDALAAAIAAFLGRAVVIERRRGEPIAIHAPADQPAIASAVARYHGRPSAVTFRVPLLGADGHPVGALAFLGDEPVVERERVACERVSTLLALELARAAPPFAAAAARSDVLPSAGPPWVVIVARQGTEPPDEGSLGVREAMRRAVRLLAGRDRLMLRGDAASLELRAVVATAGDEHDALGLALAARIADTIGRPVAVSRPFGDAAARPVAEADARATLEAVERLVDPPAVARADRAAAYRLLGSLPDLPDGVRQARALLEPLLAGRATTRRQRLETLRAVLDRDAGSDAASALGVHRNTVAYRVRRMEELAGWDLRDPELRFALSIAVRIVQDAQSSGADD